MTSHILDLICSPWAILPEAGEECWQIYQRWEAGSVVNLEELAARRGAPLQGPEPGGYELRDGVALIRVHGVLSQRMNMMANVSGGTSSELLTRDIRQAAADPAVKGLVVVMDSPGGIIAGIPNAAAALFGARERKPSAVLVDEMAASAGYWIGSAAEHVYLASSIANAGSIGVINRHVSKARALEAAGMDVTEIYAGKYKTVGSDSKRLTEEDKGVIQERVDTLYSIFVNDVARHRGKSVEQVLSDMADGRLFIGQQAIDAGLADGFHALDALVAEIADRAKWRPIVQRNQATTGPPVAAHLPPVKISMPPLPDQVAQWASENPEAASALQAEGATSERAKFSAELDAIKAAARAEGAAAEAKRAQEVRAQCLPGHEALIERLANDGRTTGPEAAQAVLAAERELRATAKTSLSNEAPAPLQHVATGGNSDEGRPVSGFINSPDSEAAIDAAVRRYMAHNPGVSYSDALDHVTKEN